LFKIFYTLIQVKTCNFESAKKLLDKDIDLYVFDTLLNTEHPHIYFLIEEIENQYEDKPTLSYYKGFIYWLEGELEEAYQHFLHALKSKRIEKWKTLINLLFISVSSKKYDTALKLCNKIRNPKNNQISYMYKAICYILKGEYKKAEILARKLKRIHPELFKNFQKAVKRKRIQEIPYELILLNIHQTDIQHSLPLNIIDILTTEFITLSTDNQTEEQL